LPLPMNEMLMTDQLQFLLRSVIALPECDTERPSIIIDRDIDLEVKSEIYRILQDTQSSKYVILNVDAPEFKKWPLANNLKLAEYISCTYPEYAVMITSLPENSILIETALDEKEIERVRYFPTPEIQTITALIRYSSFVISPDTSIVHLASAENKPVLAFYLKAGEWLPFEINSYIIVPAIGKSISTIPFDIVKDGLKYMLEEGQHVLPPVTRILQADNPSGLKIHSSKAYAKS